MTEFKPINSIVNNVFIQTDITGVYVHKTYLPKSKSNGTPVNIRRSEIEINVINTIKSNRKLIDVRIPNVISRTNNELKMELLAGLQIASYASTDFGSIQDWRKLGKWLAQTEHYLTHVSDTLFDGLWGVQAESHAVMNRLKTPNISQGKEITVSLGDVGLSNILWDGDSFAALDFEFCHLTNPGRDIAQLCAQIISTWPNSSYNTIKAIQNGYQKHGGNLAAIDFWLSDFLAYYTSKRG